MNRNEFHEQMMRLARGFQQDSRMTAERLEAMYKQVSHWDTGLWVDAVDRLLCGSRMPTLEQIIASMDDAQTRRMERRATTRDRRTLQDMADDMRHVHPDAKTEFAIKIRMNEARYRFELTPSDCVQWLRDEQQRKPSAFPTPAILDAVCEILGTLVADTEPDSAYETTWRTIERLGMAH